MNKFLTACFVFCFFSCQVFKIKTPATKNNSEQLIIYADLELELPKQEVSKIKTKINISRDSISILGYHPFLGIELGRLLIKDDIVEIQSALKNNQQTSLSIYGM